jgi:hypothetical protein
MSSVDYSIEGVVAAAYAVDGLKNFNDDSYREPLEKLLWSLQHEAQLNELGGVILRQRVVDILATRLRVQAYFNRFPQILDEEIIAPLVIVGLPRTGTTMLHRTIAADPRMIAPLWYEVRYPCPALNWDFSEAGDRRIGEAKAEMTAMLKANPDLHAIHPMDAMGPDEDIMLLEQSFYSFNTQAYANIPTFDAWLEAQDHSPGYQYFKRLLQFPQWSVGASLGLKSTASSSLHGSFVRRVSRCASGAVASRSCRYNTFTHEFDCRRLGYLFGPCRSKSGRLAVGT